MKQDFEKHLVRQGYTLKGSGYTKVIGDITHWVTLFRPVDNGKFLLQLYAYPTDNIEEDTYNTQLISISLFELKILIRLFNRNYQD